MKRKILGGNTMDFCIAKYTCDACGVKNEPTEDIIKYGFKTTSVILPDGSAKPIDFKLKEQ